MSVLIRGMEMPDTCTRCDYIGLNVAIGCKVVTGTNGRADNCPLIEVPEPHGRLIDADKLKSYWEPDHSRYFDADYFIHTIDAAKAIIPASESKERPAFLPQYELTPRSEEG